MANINIIHGDCMEAMSKMKDKEYDLAIVDPPYSPLCNLHSGHKSDNIHGWGSNWASNKHFEWNKRPPKEYFTEIDRQCNGGELAYGGINNKNALKINLEANCIPAQIVDMVAKYYNKFLEMRRPLMRKKIFDYYYSL